MRKKFFFEKMNVAIEQAQEAFKQGEVPVGAVLCESFTGSIVSTAYNQMLMRKDPTAHAEILVIQKATQKLKTLRLSSCDLYVTLEPCPMCAQAISFSRIRKVFFGAYDPKGGGVDHGARIFEASSCFSKPILIGGVQETRCRRVLQEFFKDLRLKKSLESKYKPK